MLNLEEYLFISVIIAADLEERPLITSPTLKTSSETTLRYLFLSFQVTTVPLLSPVLIISFSLKLFGLTFTSNIARSSARATLPEELPPLKIPAFVTEESNWYDTVAPPPPAFVETPVTVK